MKSFPECIDFSNFNESLYGNYGSQEGFSTLNIYVRKCMNSTLTNKTNCFPEDVIEKKLSQLFFSIGNVENDIDSNNFDNPILEYLKNDNLHLSSLIFKNYFKEMNSIKFLSDNGYFIRDEEKFISYRTERIMESVYKNTLFPGTFSQITLRCSGKTEIYSRTYLKIPATFANIGGILQAVILIGKSLTYLFSKNSMINYLIFYFLNFDEISKSIKKENENLDKKLDINLNINSIIPYNIHRESLKYKYSINKQKINRKHSLQENKNIISVKSSINQSNNLLLNNNLQIDNDQLNFDRGNSLKPKLYRDRPDCISNKYNLFNRKEFDNSAENINFKNKEDNNKQSENRGVNSYTSKNIREKENKTITIIFDKNHDKRKISENFKNEKIVLKKLNSNNSDIKNNFIQIKKDISIR